MQAICAFKLSHSHFMPFLSPLFPHLVKDNSDNLFKLLNTPLQISATLHTSTPLLSKYNVNENIE